MNRHTERNQARQSAGRERNATIEDRKDDHFNANHMHGIRVSIPFSGSVSKNYLNHSKNGGVFWAKDTAAAREALTWKIKALRHPFFKGKIWLKIFVQRPNMVGDSINTIDIIADAVKDAIGIDDRWFSIESVDWQIVKDDPQIFVWVKQDIKEAHELCSGCGEITPLSSFLPSVIKRAQENRKQGQKFCGECRKLKY